MNTPLLLDEHGNLIDAHDIQSLARAYTANAVAALADACINAVVVGEHGSRPDHTARIRASEVLLAYGFGKPTQSVQAEIKHSVDVGSFDRIAAKLERALAAAESAEEVTVQ